MFCITDDTGSYYYKFARSVTTNKLYLVFCYGEDEYGTTTWPPHGVGPAITYVGNNKFKTGSWSRMLLNLEDFGIGWRPALTALRDNKPFDDVELVYD